MRHKNEQTRGFCFINVLLVFMCLFSAASYAEESVNTATLQINFPGLSSVHTAVKTSDGVSGAANGATITNSNWKNNQTTIELPQGIYDLVIRKGEGRLIIDNVDCSGDSCQVNNIVAELTINFSGLSSVHSAVFVPDQVVGQVSGEKITSKNWQNNQAIIPVLRQIVDVAVQKGGSTTIIDNVNCQSGQCQINDLTAQLTVKFDGLSSVHTSVHVDDGNANTVDGEKITHSNWKTNQTSITILRQQVDLKINKGAETIMVHGVDCRSGSCMVDGLTANLTINFPGLNSVHTSVRIPDNVSGQASGEEFTKKNWQNQQTQIPVFRSMYDLSIVHGSSTLALDNIDCSSGSCQVDDLTTTLTVNFPGFSSVHTSIHLPDGVADSANGDKVTNLNWQNDQAVLTLFPGQYDIKIKKGGDTYIVDDFQCPVGGCEITDITAVMTVAFPGMSAMHTNVLVPDGVDNAANGELVTRKNWASDQASITVFKKSYDVSVRRKDSAAMIRDNVDCTTGNCTVDGLVAKMTVKFDGMSSVHTSVREADGAANTAGGQVFTNKNWQNNQTEIAVLKQIYDLSIKKGNSEAIIVDDVNCESGQCVVDQLTSKLTVNFPEMSGVHTSVLNPDGVDGTAQGGKVTHLNWQTDKAVLTVFKQHYDISVKRGNSEPMIIDNLDCTGDSCQVDDITATLTVEFPNMSSVHTSVLVPDNQPGVAEGKEVTKMNWQNNQAIIKVFRQIYDLKVKRSASEPMIIDAVDCTSGLCAVDQLVAELIVNFPGLRSVHTSVKVPDNVEGIAEGGEVTKQNWKNDQAKIAVFRQTFDVVVRQAALQKVIDTVDCSSGACEVNDLTSTLSIKFPGLLNVHSSTHIPDGSDNTANGERVSKSNWKSHETTIALLRETYDIKVQHQVESVFDNIDCNQANCEVLIEGNVQAFLINGDTNQALPEVSVTAYEKLSDGTLQKSMKGKTTALGQINFTLPGIETGKIYVLKAYNPFGNWKKYYSALLSNTGEYQFVVTENGENELDLTPPNITFVTPENNGSVPNLGFSITGTATDNRSIDRIDLVVSDPVKGNSTLAASYNQANNSWSADVPAVLVSVDNTIQLTATVFDLAQNQANSSIMVTVVEDNEGPVINFVSHNDNDDVPSTGFLLSGTVSDLTGVSSLSASLQDSLLPQTLIDQAIDFSISNGNWTLVIDNGLMTENGTVDITLDATDTVGNPSSNVIQLTVVPVDYSNTQMISRITFGNSPDLKAEVESIGAVTFLNQQLNPSTIDDSAFEAMLGNDPTSKEELQAWSLQHMLYSRRQLLEVMTLFWDNHFNTDINTTRANAQGVDVSNTVAFELAENQAFRANALGNFGDLLEISAKSPSMLIYLDSISNVAGDSNENYSREVDELYTMGVNGGYTDQDVEYGAEIFTGWHIMNGAFFFDATQHSDGAYLMFENTPQQILIPAGGVEQGEMLLDALARHPSTANFICGKLVTLFVNDTPPQTLVDRCALEFLTMADADDQIEQVLSLIMTSAEFNDVANYRSKIKTPVEFVIGALRNLDATSDSNDLAGPIRAMGYRLYENPVPTGWSEIGSDWINASSLIERMKWINEMVRNQPDSGDSNTDPLTFYLANGVETADGIVGYLLQLTVGDDFTDLARDNALNILGQGFDISNPDADELLRQMNGNVMSYPQYQFQ